ncbi:Uncharacterized conserved protein PhnB, glyoxalase superfamily [Amycolatopsis arida]|uniref:Uncharacterized conserved protein PhnB, glyoxalase superfamily n=1 Tax=Amycolatopsis arida TaxID=587909 RepID=A0A1I5KJS9_9PSEU|nr:VOC family protein [Amycolatopsis arida]TDX97082.1 putative glyoxalase superfamily protein PhnB [Amycolatopsis arida]SFO85285.1 Uncharacterized conserved protein PhnB, glyoxalase superfamily [Amycolatopsis arida]
MTDATTTKATTTKAGTTGPGVWPALLYTDAEAARRFLVEVLGFTETMTVHGADGTSIAHGELRWPEGGGVMYGSASLCHPERRARAQGGHGVYVVTKDPDAVHRRAAAAGARIEREPHETDHGSRDVEIADPEGNLWVFGTYPGA